MPRIPREATDLFFDSKGPVGRSYTVGGFEIHVAPPKKAGMMITNGFISWCERISSIHSRGAAKPMASHAVFPLKGHPKRVSFQGPPGMGGVLFSFAGGPSCLDRFSKFVRAAWVPTH